MVLPERAQGSTVGSGTVSPLSQEATTRLIRRLNALRRVEANINLISGPLRIPNILNRRG